MPTDQLELYCRLQECYPCTMTLCGNAVAQSTCIKHAQSHSHLLKHVLVSVNLWVATYSTMQHTYQSIAVIHLYNIRTCNTLLSNTCLGFSYAGQIRVWSRLLSRLPGFQGQQLWPSFNTDTDHESSHLFNQKQASLYFWQYWYAQKFLYRDLECFRKYSCGFLKITL